MIGCLDFTAMCVYRAVCNSQARTITTAFTITGLADSNEGFEDFLQHRPGDPGTTIFYLKPASARFKICMIWLSVSGASSCKNSLNHI